MKPFCLALAFVTYSAMSQDNAANFNKIADEVISNESEEDQTILESRYENLTQLLSNPVDLNSVSAEELRQFFFLNENQIQQFIKYRSEQGALVSVYELQAIPGFDQNAIAALAPLVKVIDPGHRVNSSLLNRMTSAGNAYLIIRCEKTLEPKLGYSNAIDSTQKYQGTDLRFFTRFRSSVPLDYSFGFTLEKDAGEQFRWQPGQRKFGTDYNSVHLQLMNKGRLKNLIVGDYQAQFAQGVILGGAFGLGKSAETITTPRRTSIGFVPHTSAGESGFHRGIAATYQVLKRIRVSGFASQVIRDATLNEDDTGNTISSMQYSGFHRNTREQESSRNTNETILGSVVHYSRNNLDAGLIVQHLSFQYPVVKESNLYNQFTFSGKQNLNAGFFYNYTKNNFNFFGEAAKSLNGGFAGVAGLLGSLTSALDIAIVYRNYGRSYYSFYSNPFSENTQPQNETGIYWGLKYKWNRRWVFASYIDLFRFPWLGFRRYAPTSGYEWLTRITFQPSRKMTLFLQARQSEKARNLSEETTHYSLAYGRKSNVWASFNYAEGTFRLRTRLQYSTFSFNQETSDGIVLIQGIGFESGKFQFTAHYALFQTDDFDNRQYVYENDVYLVFSLPSYDGNGVRSMLMAQYAFSKKLSVSLRYARIYYRDKQEIGSGLEMITGNVKNDVKFQAVIRF